MMKCKNLIFFLSFPLVVLCLTDCKRHNQVEDDLQEPVAEKEYSRSSLVQNWAENIITPSFGNLVDEIGQLHTIEERFAKMPSKTALDSLRSQLFQSHKAWQALEWFRYRTASTQFGTVEGAKRIDRINAFPANTVKIEEYISNADYTLANEDFNTHGFAALDYLLFNKASLDSVVAQFQNAPARIKYLTVLVQDLKNRVALAHLAWPLDEGAFLSALGTDTKSTISITLSELNIALEYLTDIKLGIPVGRVQLGYQLPAFPEKVEGFYSGYSVDYLQANLASIERLWSGNSSRTGAKGYGLDDCLQALEQHVLKDSIDKQFESIYVKMELLADNRLSDLIVTQQSTVKEVYVELQKLTRYFKTDVVTILGVSIDSQSGDGD